MLLLIEFENVIHEDVLGSTQPGHDIGGKKGRKLQGEMPFRSSLGLCLDGVKHDLKSGLDFELIHFWKTLDYEASNAVDILLLKSRHVIDERLDAFTGGKKRGY